ncbi:hypothetical protein VNO77_02097 [Canavalia gladiata]|uniref:Uncharacterized protein n=1 Tax=Canavalia gladiata TaxID=3824 RepID=A0AAN9MSE9_CANGL
MASSSSTTVKRISKGRSGAENEAKKIAPIYFRAVEKTKKIQITFTILVKVLMSIGPGEDLDLLKREFEEFIKGIDLHTHQVSWNKTG